MLLGFVQEIRSLYYFKDLGQSGSDPLYTNSKGVDIVNSRFAIGPSTGRKFHDNERQTFEFDRGPCKTPASLKSPILMAFWGTL